MEYRIAVCDDDAAQGEYLKNLVSTYMAQREHTAQISVFRSAQAVLFEGCEQFDVFLLDIEMPGISGMELAQTVRRRHPTAVIVFVTGYSEYIAQGYDVSALHYLMKPVDKDKLFSVLDKACGLLGKRDRFLHLETAGESYYLPLSEIRYLEVHGNYVTVHASADVTAKKTLSDLESQLDERFARTGRSFVVNLTYVRRVTRTEVILTGGETVPLSRGMYETVNRAIIERM
ncbi:MAG: response regulator transcription factor [Clostridia bacterium]|nr:response regulator transcription factor [Clostridia bacterium]